MDAQDKSLQFSIDIAMDAPRKLYTDRQRIEQILKNLLANAMKYSGDARSIEVDVRRAGQHVAIGEASRFECRAIEGLLRRHRSGHYAKQHRAGYDPGEQLHR